MDSQEKRRSPRIEYHLPVFLNQGSGTTYGEIKDLCDGGVFIKTSLLNSKQDRFKVNETAVATFYFLGGNSTLSVTLSGSIVRVTEDGLAFTSRELETGAFLNFDSLILLYDNDHPHLTEECLNQMARNHTFPATAHA